MTTVARPAPRMAYNPPQIRFPGLLCRYPRRRASRHDCPKRLHEFRRPSARRFARHRPFAFYWVARISATVALQMQTVAIGWQMYDLTNNPLDLGLVGLFQFMPAIVLVLVAGHIADRYDRRKIVRTCQIVAGLASATLATGTAGGWLTREALLGIVLVIGAARTFEATTFQTLLPAVVPMPLLARATAASSSATQLAVIAGPALGGLLYAVSPVLVYALCCTLYMSASRPGQLDPDRARAAR